VTLIAHGLVGRTDLPIPEWLFGWAAAVVLIVSFVALAVLWPRARWESDRWRPLPAWTGRLASSRALEAICGAVGAALLGLVVWSGFAGTQSATANLAPTFVYVVFWLGLVPASVLLGDVFRAFNPWRAIARGVAGVAGALARRPLPEPLPYPERLGRWPAVAGILAFAWMELVASGGDVPENIAVATLLYSALTWVCMALYGIEPWLDRGEAFSVYFNLFSRIAPLERRGPRLGVRPPLSGLTRLDPVPGTVPLLAMMIGSVTFDGAAEGEPWTDVAPDLADAFQALGLSPDNALELAFGAGLLAAIAFVYVFYRLGIAGARSVGGRLGSGRLAGAFVHSLVPIALVYAAAHYFTLLLFQGQAIAFLASDPLGEGWDVFGTAGSSIDYGLIGATTTWYVQVAFVVAGHVAALTLAHDRAIALYDEARLAVRSQYWMLGVMVGFTTLALWLLAQSNE
jgi:hypothetical protein